MVQSGLHPLHFPVCLHVCRMTLFLKMDSIPAFAGWLPVPRLSSLPYVKTQSAHPSLKSLRPYITCSQLLWTGKSVWMDTGLPQAQGSASLEQLCQCQWQIGRPAATTVPVFAPLCNPCLEKVHILWLALHQSIKCLGMQLHVTRLESPLANAILFLLA